MALSESSLSGAIESNLKSAGFKIIAQNKALCDAVAKAVVEHIQANAEVAITGGSSAGVYKVS